MSKAKRTPPVTPAERVRLEAAMRLIERSVRNPLRLVDVATVARMSPWHLHRRFKACFGETPLQAATRYQVETAKRLMLAGEPLAAVARKAGFSTQSHFCGRFKQVTGTRPTAWLRAQR